MSNETVQWVVETGVLGLGLGEGSAALRPCVYLLQGGLRSILGHARNHTDPRGQPEITVSPERRVMPVELQFLVGPDSCGLTRDGICGRSFEGGEKALTHFSAE